MLNQIIRSTQSIALLFLIFSQIVNANTYDTNNKDKIWYQNDIFDITKGLSHNGVTDIYRDSRGYLWIATYDGLNRYNGYTIKIFKNTIKSNLLPNNRVRSIIEDKDGRIWIGTDEGIAIYDYTKDAFTIIEQRRELIARNLQLSADGNYVYCITEKGEIIAYSSYLEKLWSVKYDGVRAVFDVLKLDNKTLLLASSDGLLQFDIELRVFRCVLEDQIKYTSALSLIDNESLLVALEKGVVKVNYVCVDSITAANSHVTTFKFEIASSLSLENYYVNNIYLTNKSEVWLGTTSNGALYIPNVKNGLNTNVHLLPSKRISGFYTRNENEMFISTFDTGLINYTHNSTPFKLLPKNYVMPQIELLSGDTILIRQNGEKGGELYDFTTGETSRITADNGCSVVDFKNQLWCFSKDEYIVYTSNSNTGVRHKYPSALSSHPRVASIDTFGRIWIGCEDNVYRMTLNTHYNSVIIESIKENPIFNDNNIGRVRVIYADHKDGVIWIGTDTKGLYRIESENNSLIYRADIQQYHKSSASSDSLSSNFISAIVRSPGGQLWVGTEQGGICKVSEKGSKLRFRTYTEDDGLSNNVVKSILVGNNENVWIGTNIGLNLFDVQNERFVVYRTKDGLPFDEFSYSAVQTDNGDLLFAGSNSIMHFHQDDILFDLTMPQLHFSGLSVYNREVSPREIFNGRVLLEQSLNHGSKLVFNHDENVLNIGVDLISEDMSTPLSYCYMLEPTNTDWTTVNASSGSILLNSLAPNEYTLRVRGISANGKHSKDSVVLISVLPPIWRSTIAYIIYILLLCLILFITVKILLSHKSLKYRLSYEIQQREIQKKAESEKLEYFSNISHELKTPLTLIMAPLEVMMNRFKFDVNIKANLKIMQRQAKRMQQLINLAHGIQLKDNNVLQMQTSVFVYRDFLAETIADYEFLAHVDKKSFKVEYPDALLKVRADYNMLEMMVNNLLNNAFKYTTSGGEIVVRYLADNEKLTLTISDTGCGISSSDLPSIFERWYRSEDMEELKVGGTGIGLAFTKYVVEQHRGSITVQSTPKKGTIFTVSLPIIIESMQLPPQPIDEVQSESDMIITSMEQHPENNGKIVNEELENSLVYIVEDNSEMREFIASTLSNYFKVKQFSRASECLEQIGKVWPDIIISDIMMPEMNGDVMCSLLKENIATCHIPIILLSARSTVDDKISGLQLGADAYIEKPFYPQYLIERIISILKVRKQLRNRFLGGFPMKVTNLDSTSEQDVEILKKLYTLFDRNLDNEDFEIDNHISEFNVSRSVFFPKIKALTNMSPSELLKHYRLQRAAEMLSKGKHNVNEVYIRTGFKCRTHFSRSFKEKYNISPSKFRTSITTVPS